MRYETIAGTEIVISEIGFGVWTLATTWWGEHTDEEAISLLREARDLGITFFDTADTYGNGRGETILADAFSPSERADIVIGTKFGYNWRARTQTQEAGHKEAPQVWDPAFLENALNESLQRLNTEYIDIWQLHNPRLDTLQRDDVWEFLDRVRKDGRVRSVGVAIGPDIGWEDEGVYALSERNPESAQVIYSLLEMDPAREFIRTARRHKTSLLARVPHATGLLEGRFTEDTVFPASDHRSHRPRSWLSNGLKKAKQLQYLTESGSTIGQAALRFVLREPEIVSVLPNIFGRE
ncbi:MAG: aldo/keto reductase, partial [Dehalococcoidia bacterium]